MEPSTPQTLDEKTQKLVSDLTERSKELACLYSVEEALRRKELTIGERLEQVVQALPPGWKYPDICEVRLTYGSDLFRTSDFEETPWFITAAVTVEDDDVGDLAVFYTEEMPDEDVGPFLNEEIRLLTSIAERLSQFILHQKLQSVMSQNRTGIEQSHEQSRGEWRVVLDMIRKTDPNLFMSLLRKILHQLCWKDVGEAESLLRQSSIARGSGDDDQEEVENRPLKKKRINTYDQYIQAILKLADEHLGAEEILSKVQKWIQEAKSSELIKVVEDQDSSLTEIGDAIRKYYHLAPEKFQLSSAIIKGLRVSMCRRFFTDRLDFINVAKEHFKLTDFYRLIDRMIFPPTSRGKIGGKGSGLIIAHRILQRKARENEILSRIYLPKTWYMTSDGIIFFMHYNHLEEVLEQKYKPIDEVRLEYPQIVQVFKNSEFPPDLVKAMSAALDDFDDTPLVVRSSSLMEDQMGAAFSGKYKSLFLANQGTKRERLTALMDAVAEVYASIFSPDAIEYRAERNLIDFHEEMGILIQEVVGTQVGRYFLPAYAGVAFSNNEFRWSPRIKRQDGLVRLVPGLGTAAVDRLGDDYPVLVAPGQPGLQVNASVADMVRYSTRNVDVINLKTNEFETIEFRDLLRNCGEEFPALEQVVSVLEHDMLRPVMGFGIDFDKDDLVVTFDGLTKRTDFVKKVDAILKTLQEAFGTPIDIEFASDGKHFYLLQCRPQSFLGEHSSDPIPKNITSSQLIFSANRFVSNGKVPEISHVVYVDPSRYADLPDRTDMVQIGRAIGKLNKVLPKRKFILMGPGRWGSRGDIKLGVPVTYSDINNTAMLVEIARKKGQYLPDLSFGTHFFQDLVEASIRYLPLYPDDPGIAFNESFFRDNDNILTEILPDFAHLADTIRVIDVPASCEGKIFRILMNAERDEAVALLVRPGIDMAIEHEALKGIAEQGATDHWRWRFKMAEVVAANLDAPRFGVRAMYLIGSTKNANAGPQDDIDLVVHVDGDPKKQQDLSLWFEGWSLCLREYNFLKTGEKTDSMLDIHFVTDRDIEKNAPYADRIHAVADKARPLAIGTALH